MIILLSICNQFNLSTGHNLQLSCYGLSKWWGAILVVPVMATRFPCPISIPFNWLHVVDGIQNHQSSSIMLLYLNGISNHSSILSTYFFKSEHLMIHVGKCNMHGQYQANSARQKPIRAMFWSMMHCLVLPSSITSYFRSLFSILKLIVLVMQ